MKSRILLLLLALITACSRDIPEGVTELVYATPYPPSHPFSMADQEWMDYVHEQSGGSLKIVPNWSGALLSSEHSMQEIRHGVADIGLITPIYVRGGAHLIRMQSGFYSDADTVEKQIALYRCMTPSSEQFDRELEGLKILAIQGGSLPGIITTQKQISSLDDLRGLRLRAPSELLEVLQDLDVDVVTMPMGDVYSALAKGVIDGVVAPLDTFRSLHFTDVARYYAELEVPRGAYPARAMREQRWDELNERQRQVLENSIPVWEAALAHQVREATQRGIEQAETDGIVFTAMPAEDQERFDALYLSKAEKNAALLDQYNIDGRIVFKTARASIDADGNVSCSGGNN